MRGRILTLITKELRQLLATRRDVMLLLMPLLLQLAIFPFATTLETRNATLAVLNEDQGAAAVEFVQRVAAASAFSRMVAVQDAATLRRLTDAQEVLLAIRIPPDFSRRLMAGQHVDLQAVIDGRRSNAAQIAHAYIGQILAAFVEERTGAEPPARLVVRNLYNPNLDYKWFVLPSLVAIIATIGCLLVTALSLAREREEGTFDQLLVTPLTPAHIMLGKAVPGILVAMVQGGIIALAAVFLYRVPLTGPVWLLALAMLAYAFALCGIGLLISAVSASQQQAFLGVFCFMVPSVVLSGYLAPVENMPAFLRGLSTLNPLTHFIATAKGIFLKSYGLAEVRPALSALFAIGVVSLLAAHAVFWRQTRS